MTAYMYIGTDGPNNKVKPETFVFTLEQKKTLSSMLEFNYSQFLTNSPLKIFQLGIGWLGLAK